MVAHPAALLASLGGRRTPAAVSPPCSVPHAGLPRSARAGASPPPAPRSQARSSAGMRGAFSHPPDPPPLFGGGHSAGARAFGLAPLGGGFPPPVPQGGAEAPRAGAWMRDAISLYGRIDLQSKKALPNGRALYRYAPAQDSLSASGLAWTHPPGERRACNPSLIFSTLRYASAIIISHPGEVVNPPMQKKFTPARGERAAPSAHSRN